MFDMDLHFDIAVLHRLYASRHLILIERHLEAATKWVQEQHCEFVASQTVFEWGCVTFGVADRLPSRKKICLWWLGFRQGLFRLGKYCTCQTNSNPTYSGFSLVH